MLKYPRRCKKGTSDAQLGPRRMKKEPGDKQKRKTKKEQETYQVLMCRRSKQSRDQVQVRMTSRQTRK